MEPTFKLEQIFALAKEEFEIGLEELGLTKETFLH